MSLIRGFDATQSRIQELQAKLERLSGNSSRPSIQATPSAEGNNFASTLSGLISKGQGDAPLDPIATGLMQSPVTGPKQNIIAMVHAAAERHGLDPKLFEALVQQESNFDPNARSSAGALGLAQLMPKTAASLGVTNPLDPLQSLNGGAKYLAQMMKEFGDVKLALAAYNAGPGAVKRAGGIPPFKETQNYVQKIMGNYRGGS